MREIRIQRRHLAGAALLLLVSRVAPAALTPRDWPRRPGVVLYRLKTSATTDQRAALDRVLQSGVGRTRVSALETSKSHKSAVFPVPPDKEEELSLQVQNTGAVDFAEPDYLLPAALTPNDEEYPAQWHHDHIHTPAAWDLTQGAPNVVVAVCDTGVDASHPDLAANLLTGYNVVDRNQDTSPVAAHGTEVAGTVAAIGNNHIGMAGVSWNTKILPVRITDNSDTTAWCSDMAEGIEWAAENGAQIINLSYYTVGCPNTIESAAAYARTHGSLTVVAAGNQGDDLSSNFPSQHTFLFVAGTDNHDVRASFSNFGLPIDLAAPAISIGTLSPGGGYLFADGTSFSSPLVAGAASLILAAFPSATADQLKDFLTSTAHDLGGGMGHGLLDVGAAVIAAQSVAQGNHAPTVSILPPAVAYWPAAVSLSATVSDDGLPSPPRLSVTWSKLSGPGSVAFSDVHSASATVTLGYAGHYELRLTASDGALSASQDVGVDLEPGSNGQGGLPAPILHAAAFMPVNGTLSASMPAPYSAHNYQWMLQPSAGGPAGQSSVPGSRSANWGTDGNATDLSGLNLSPGYYAVSVQAFDASGIASDPAQAYVTLTAADLNQVRVYPNPWRADRHGSHPLKFDQLAGDSTIKLFTLSGHLIRTLASSSAEADWDLKNDTGDAVASGLYFYLISYPQGAQLRGKIAIIR